MLSRAFELFKEIQQFLRYERSPLANAFNEPQFRLCDVGLFALVNELKQGRDINILRAKEELSAFFASSVFGANCWELRELQQSGHGASRKQRDRAHGREHPQASRVVERYFSSATKNKIHHPFAFPLEGRDDSHAGKEELIELKSGEVFWRIFENASSECLQLQVQPERGVPGSGQFGT